MIRRKRWRMRQGVNNSSEWLEGKGGGKEQYGGEEGLGDGCREIVEESNREL